MYWLRVFYFKLNDFENPAKLFQNMEIKEDGKSTSVLLLMVQCAMEQNVSFD